MKTNKKTLRKPKLGPLHYFMHCSMYGSYKIPCTIKLNKPDGTLIIEYWDLVLQDYETRIINKEDLIIERP